MYDPSVEELNIEEFLMQEASSGSGLDALDHSGQDSLGKVQEEAANIVDRAVSTREEVSKRVQEFEPLINIAKGEEIEITQEHLQVLDNKVAELEGISHGQNIVQEETEPRSAMGNIVQSVSSYEPAEHTREVSDSTDSTQPQELNIESMIMQEATSDHHDQILSDSQKYLYREVQGAAEAVQKGINDTKDEVSQRMLGFEPLLYNTKSEEQEITEEHLEAINEKLSEIHDVSFGHDLKIFQEIENPKPVEEVLQDIINQQTPVKEQVSQTMQEIEEKDFLESIPKDNTKAQTKGTTESSAVSLEAAAELEDSISQVAKPVVLDDSYTSTAPEVKVDIQVDPQGEASQAESISSTQIVSDGASSSLPHTSQTPGTPDGTGGAVPAEISSMAATAAGAVGASYTVASASAATTVVAAASTIAATAAAPSVATAPPSMSHEDPAITPEASAAPAKPKPKLLGKKPLAKEKPKSTVCIVYYYS